MRYIEYWAKHFFAFLKALKPVHSALRSEHVIWLQHLKDDRNVVTLASLNELKVIITETLSASPSINISLIRIESLILTQFTKICLIIESRQFNILIWFKLWWYHDFVNTWRKTRVKSHEWLKHIGIQIMLTSSCTTKYKYHWLYSIQE